MLTADVVVFSVVDGDFHVLLIKRGWAPFEGCWALPGGKVDLGETFERAALRELAEEAGIALGSDDVRRVGVYDAPARDPRGRYVSCAYMALVGGDVTATAGDDATDARWVSVADLLADQDALAFDHARILADAVALLD
ncbi:MAG: NUDIX hydrolase [Actinomycetota bacterium]|nr:NUDIX hydrolase [Actinomycetota bacterium]